MFSLLTNTDLSGSIVQLFTKGMTIMKEQASAPGLYDPAYEHDACGVGFVVDIKGRKSHGVIEKGLQILLNLLHRGACGCEANTGDGAGVLVQMPDRFLRKATA